MNIKMAAIVGNAGNSKYLGLGFGYLLGISSKNLAKNKHWFIIL